MRLQSRHGLVPLVLIAAMVSGGITPVLGQRDTIRTGVDLVVVPVSVKDGVGRFIYDLQQSDFTVFEDGRPQQIAQFSIDPLPLSVAVLVDTGMGRASLRRFANAIVSLSSSFTPTDEAGIYRFDTSVTKLSDFTNSSEQIEKSLAVVQTIAERTSGPFTWTIFPGRGPRWLRWLLDHGTETRLLNDAIFAAAADLEQRASQNRKVIIVLSDGQAVHNKSSVADVRNRLVRSQIQFYGITVSIPVVAPASSVLETYAHATGGDMYSGRTVNGMQSAFARVTEQARHQYVLSYVSSNEVSGLSSVVRKIDLKTSRPGLEVHHRPEYVQYPSTR
jgi:VWFA-related protein